jgi:hypothetical protein
MRRAHWPAGDQIQAWHPDDASNMTQPYLYLNTDEGVRIPYILLFSDIFAQDWEDTLPTVTRTEIPYPFG